MLRNAEISPLAPDMNRSVQQPFGRIFSFSRLSIKKTFSSDCVAELLTRSAELILTPS